MPVRKRFELVSPLATVIETAEPMFRWKALPGAESYAVRVVDERFKFLAESPH
jgi:hypothetical protein